MDKDLLERNYELLEHYGIFKQITIWIEEMSELTKELCKWQRRYDELEGDLTSEMLENIKKESTDVQVSLDQIKKAIHYTYEEQVENYAFKVERQHERIKDDTRRAS